MSDSSTVTSVTFWTCIIQVIALTSSSFVLSAQKIYQNRSSHVGSSHLKNDTVRDIVNKPFSNGSRVARVIVETLLSTMISGYLFVIQVLTFSGANQNPLTTFTALESGARLAVWVYCFALAITASQHPLPSKWGWTLNAHLCTIYTVLAITTIEGFLIALWNSPAISFAQTSPLVIPIFFTFDLVYATATMTNGLPFLDENGRVVNGSTIASIYSTLFFTWLTPIIKLVNRRGSELSDEDLPSLPSTHRAHNMFYIFREHRGAKLLYRIYKANIIDIVAQACFASVLPVLYYATPFFLNKLLLVIEEISSGDKDSILYLKGMGYVLAMSAFIIITDLLVAQLWYFAQSNVELRVRAMLNLEIYRKTLLRMDTSIISGGKAKASDNRKDNQEEDDQDDDDDDGEDEDGSLTGKIVNLMSTDSQRISDFASWWFVLIEDSLQLVIGVYFLYTLLGWSCILGLLILIITLPINHYNSKLYIKKQNDLMKARDKRVSLMNEVLQGIRQVKFFAWEANWTQRILNARNVELSHLKAIYLNDIVFTALWQGTPLLFNTVAFWSFTKLEGRELTAPIAFTSITIFIELRSSLTIIPETITHLFEALISINRIDKFLAEEEIKQPILSSPVDNPSFSEIKIGFKNATIGWPSISSRGSVVVLESNERNLEPDNEIYSSSESTVEQEEDTFVLRDLNVIFPNNKLSLICGATGSGKTLIMLSLLGETEIKDGFVHCCPRSTLPSTLDSTTAITSIKVSEDADVVPNDWILQHAVAYVSQTAWLQNASIKDNILFGLPLAQKRYKATLAACALEKDLFYLEDGDETEIGEKGITLSGGQKARVALARAVYSRAQNVLMDDILSAVDAHTAKHLYKQCLLGPLMKGRTQILITHHVNLCLQGSAHVVFIKEGRIMLSGSPTELKQAGQLSQIFEENIAKEETTEEEEPLVAEDQIVETNGLKNTPKTLVEDETRVSGTVKLKLYKLYLGLFGNWAFWAFVFVTIFGARGLNIAASWWLKNWAQSYEHSSEGGNASSSTFLMQGMQAFTSSVTAKIPDFTSPKIDNISTAAFSTSNEGVNKLNMYLGIYILLNFADLFVVIIRSMAGFAGGLFASKKLYVLLLDRVFRAPLRFFDTTPVGRIVNRFSKDFETIDDEVSSNSLEFLVEWTEVISIAIVATSVLPALVLLMIFVVAINVYFGYQYVSASRELKRMDSVSRSPLFTHFSETITGVATIRAFGMTQQFMLDMINKIDVNSRPMYYAWTISRWASIRIAIMGSSISLITGMFILMNLEYIDAATAGFCLSYVLTFTNVTYWGVRRYTDLEMDFNSVERVVEYLDIDQEAPIITDIRVPSDWPNQGGIEVKNLQARYAPDLEPVLKGLSFSIKPQEKIGIVGRTGSGKSTLALAFFRFIELSAGSIVIDGVDISHIGTEDLRSSLTVIPQDPVLFSGTLQSNMDPFNQFNEEEIFTALRRVHLLNDDSEDVNENVFKNLQTTVSERGNNFSQGQRQLLCLARALLKSSRIVLMDEATASVDFETDKAIQKTITTEFAQSTILCIAHRLNTVIEYDRILVLDHGEIVEFASPLKLLNDSYSAFYSMCLNSGEFDALMELAKAKHELIDLS